MTKHLITLVAALLLGAAAAYAAENGNGSTSGSSAGAAELQLIQAILTGNIGLVLGLGVTILGVLIFVRGETGKAMFTILLGVLITMTPGIYNGLRLIACPIAESLGGHCGK